MLRVAWHWIVHNNWVFGPLCALLGVLITVFFGPSVKAISAKLWDKLKTYFSGRYFENTFLEWMIAGNQYLPSLPTTLVPVTEGHRHELDRLYVSLSISCEDRTHSASTMNIAEIFRNNRKVVILGDPGSGKTTILRFLALTFARARRNHPTGTNKAERARSAIKIRQARKRVLEEFELSVFPLPIFVLLNRLRDVNDWPKSRSMLDYLREEWSSVDSLRRFPPDFFDRKLKAGECIFLFDAFDELGNEDARNEIARRVGTLSNAAPPGNRFIVTSRIVGYNGQLADSGFTTLKVEPLSWNQISDLVIKWYEDLSQPALSRQLLDTLEVNPRVKDLAVNPMLLSLIALVQYVQRLIPDRRDVLYDTCVAILMERRYAPASVRQAYDSVLPSDEAVLILQKIARNLHQQRRREIPRNVLQDSIIPEILHAMRTRRAAAASSADILRNIEERSQLLVERGHNADGRPIMAFSHLTFQEYLTSVDLKRQTVAKGLEAVTSTLLTLYDQDRDWWEEVALLFGAQLDPSEQEYFFRQLYPRRERRSQWASAGFESTSARGTDDC